jgi:hypothetical protein
MIVLKIGRIIRKNQLNCSESAKTEINCKLTLVTDNIKLIHPLFEIFFKLPN